LHGLRSVRGGSAVPDLTRLRYLVTPLPEDLDMSRLGRCPDLTDVTFSEVAERDLGSLTELTGVSRIHLIGTSGCTIRGFDELEGMTGLTSLQLNAVDGDAWLRGFKSIPPSLVSLTLLGCVVPSDPQVFARLSRLEAVSLLECRTPDGIPVTGLDVPGVRIYAN